ARHNFKLPNAVGDLQKGEKYMNMDYLFFSVMRHRDLKVLNVSYDIACQWSRNLWTRMRTLGVDYWMMDYDKKTVKFLVPKFHLPMHIEKCQVDFSFNLTKNVGRTDGEAPERRWANINPIA
ncbi:hypothetical protein M405DRAFT_701156, partial [Rhizopogon salebrosus TDB-379]